MFNERTVIPIFSTPIFWEKKFHISSKEEECFFDSLEKTKRDNGYTLLTNNKHILEYDEFSRIKKLMLERVYVYITEVYCISLNNLEVEITNSWGTVNKENSFHETHTHPHSLISATYYLNCDSGDLTFYQRKNSLQKDYYINFEYIENNFFNSNSWTIPVRTGDLCIFPSHLSHQSELNKFDNDRKMIGLNVWLRGVVGQSDAVDVLKL